MPWLKGGDNAATYPPLMAVQGDAIARDEPWLVNEAFGFILRCALQSAGHMTDYKIDIGTAVMLGGGRHDLLLKLGVKHGLLTVKGRGAARRWVLVDDPEFLHIKLRSEVEIERARGRDNRNPLLTVPVRLRDGDFCRFCGKAVQWSSRKTSLGGTYDHLIPPPAGSMDDMVVACKSCNSRRGGGEELELLPAPEQPLYRPCTVAFADKHGFELPAHGKVIGPDDTPGLGSRPRTERDTAPKVAGSRCDSRDPAPVGDTAAAVATPEDTDPGVATPVGDTAAGWSTLGDTAPGVATLDTSRAENLHAIARKVHGQARASPPTWANGFADQVDPTRSEVLHPGRVGKGTGEVGPGSGRGGSGLDVSGSDPPRGRRGRSRRGKGKQ